MGKLAAGALVDALRATILDGGLRPGTRLDETRLGAQFEVSRNTLREAFRVLAHEHLVEHLPNRGVFVRRPSVREARDVYETRRLLECGALREAAVRRAAWCGEPDPDGSTRERHLQHHWETSVLAVVDAAERGWRASESGDWDEVGSANGQFHLALATLADNDVILRTLRSLVTEMRLLFLVVAAAREVHEPYLEDNRRIASLVASGELVRAAILLEDYLLRAERHLVGLYATHTLDGRAVEPRS
ncbi:GntR family transcriptional regulator [Lapillicoccus sp.]|uniref:GntR family transcriptional regulator n=1 Tax=Lapillicoccus sp. TaxID=1909287 RepID=UPI0025EA1D5F|nr:GntR family transcriptional regulator [Lapillicoccus sp.]